MLLRYKYTRASGMDKETMKHRHFDEYFPSTTSFPPRFDCDSDSFVARWSVALRPAAGHGHQTNTTVMAIRHVSKYSHKITSGDEARTKHGFATGVTASEWKGHVALEQHD